MRDTIFQNSMCLILGDIDYSVWVRAGFGVHWREWSVKEENMCLREQWGIYGGFEVGAHLDNTFMREDVVVHSEMKDLQMLCLQIDSPTRCEVRVLLHSSEQLQASTKEYIRLLIREQLLEDLVEKQRIDHDRWLQSLRELTSSLDLNELLINIMHNALTIIPSVECGFFMMEDTQTGKLIPRASVGMGEQIYGYQVEKGEGITGKVFNEGKGRIYDTKAIVHAMDNVTEKNMDSIASAFSFDPSPKAVMAVPVTMNKNKIGVMLVHQIYKENHLDEYDLHQLQGFADQAAIAISNARLYFELRESNRYLVKRNEIHEVFTKLSIKDDNLKMVVETVGRMIGLSVVFVDSVKNERYPNLTKTHDLAQIDLFRVLEDKMNPVTVKGASSHEYYLYPIVNGSVLLGCFVVELSRPLQQLDHVVMEQGGAVVVLKMVNTYSLTEMYYRRSHEFFNELVLYREPKRIEANLTSFGLPKTVPLFVCVLHLSGENQDLKKQETYLRQLIANIERELGKRDILMFGAHDKVTILMAAEGTTKRNQMIEKLRVATDRWATEDKPQLCGGIGGLYKGLEHVAKSSDEANRSLSFLLGRGKAGIFRYEDIGINKLFLNLKAEEIEDYINEMLSPLRMLRSHSGELEYTL